MRQRVRQAEIGHQPDLAEAGGEARILGRDDGVRWRRPATGRRRRRSPRSRRPPAGCPSTISADQLVRQPHALAPASGDCHVHAGDVAARAEMPARAGDAPWRGRAVSACACSSAAISPARIGMAKRIAPRRLVDGEDEDAAVALLDQPHGGLVAHSSVSGLVAMKRRRCSVALPYWLASTIAFRRYRPTSYSSV